MTLPQIALGDAHALFLDFDGTLVEIAQRPDTIALARSTVEALSRLEQRLGGALAIISGREIEDIDRFLAPRKFAMAGVHGLMRRDARGVLHEVPFDRAAFALVEASLDDSLPDRTGLYIERKSGAIALHYRRRPQLAAPVLVAAERVAENFPQMRVTAGKMVVELRLGSRDKGSAIREFLAEAPFAGRLPIFAGDDVTDEDGFAVVNTLGGVSIKVGSGPTLATYRADDTPAFLDWITSLAQETRGAA